MVPIFEIVRTPTTLARDAEFRYEESSLRWMELVILHNAEPWTYNLDLDAGLEVCSLPAVLPYQPTEVLSLSPDCSLDVEVMETTSRTKHRLRLSGNILEHWETLKSNSTSIGYSNSRPAVRIWRTQSKDFPDASSIPPRTLILRIWFSTARPGIQETCYEALPTPRAMSRLWTIAEQDASTTSQSGYLARGTTTNLSISTAFPYQPMAPPYIKNTDSKSEMERMIDVNEKRLLPTNTLSYRAISSAQSSVRFDLG